MVTSLDVFLLLSNEAEVLREELKKSDKDSEYFSKMFSTWCFNPISALILCIISQNFELAFNLILRL